MLRTREKAIGDVVSRRRDFPELEPLLWRIRRRYAPSAVLLFGSRARGDNRPTSDWDLLVLLRDGADEELRSPMVAWEVTSHSSVNVDLVVEYERDFLFSLPVTMTLAYEIKNDLVRIL
jgi:predicted nucleotidyltransferase